jgi:hypothetical protein
MGKKSIPQKQFDINNHIDIVSESDSLTNPKEVYQSSSDEENFNPNFDLNLIYVIQIVNLRIMIHI